MQPLDRRAGAEFEMQHRREAVFTFKPSSLTVTGHGELDGAYQKLGSRLTPIGIRAGQAVEEGIHGQHLVIGIASSELLQFDSDAFALEG